MMGAEMLAVRQWLLHDPQSNPLAYRQHPDSRSCNFRHGRPAFSLRIKLPAVD